MLPFYMPGTEPAAPDLLMAAKRVFDEATRETLGRPEWADVRLESEWVGDRVHRALRRVGIERLGQLTDLTVEGFLSDWSVRTESLRLLRQGVEIRLRLPALRTYPLFEGLVRSAMEGILRDVPLQRAWLDDNIFDACVSAGIGSVGELAAVTEGQATGTMGLGLGSIARLKTGVAQLLTGVHGAALSLQGETTPQFVPPAGDTTVRDVLRAYGLKDSPGLDHVLAEVNARDRRYGLSNAPQISLYELLEGAARGSVVSRSPEIARHLAERISRLAQRMGQPIPLLDELNELLPDNRSNSMFRARWGWNGLGKKTLDEVARSEGVTRERIRQITKKVEGPLRRRTQYLPTANAIVALVVELGGATHFEDLADEAKRRGLIRGAQDLEALESLERLGLVSALSSGRLGGLVAGAIVGGDEAAISQINSLSRAVRRELSRRGIVSVDDLAQSLSEGKEFQVTADQVEKQIVREEGVEKLAAGYYWQPKDPDSAFLRRLLKPLLKLGPQTPHALIRALQRSRRARDGSGPTAPRSVLLAALDASEYLREVGERLQWSGPDRQISLGSAEAAVLAYLQAEGPAVTSGVLKNKLIPEGVDAATLGLALATSTVLDRVAPSIYAPLGTDVLPSDIEHARQVGSRLGKVMTSRGLVWTPSGPRLGWDVHDPSRWAGTLGVPERLNLEGEWSLFDALGRNRGTFTVKGTALWGKLLGIVNRAAQNKPIGVSLTFDQGTRRAHLSLSPLGRLPTADLDWASMTSIRLRWGGFPLRLACNAAGQVWLVERSGHIPADARQYLTGLFEAIDLIIVPAVTSHRPEGGRFVVDTDGVRLADSGLLILGLTPKDA